MKRNFQILSPLDFLAEFTQHRPSLRSGTRPKGSHLIRYYGWYSNKSRGTRKQAEAEASAASASEETAPTGSSQTWAMLIKRVYEVDPLCWMRPSWEIAPYFAFIDLHFLVRQAPISLTIARNGRGACVQKRPGPSLHTRQVVSFIEPPQADVIEEILQHCGLWQSHCPRTPPEVDELVLQLDAAYSGSSIDSPDPADQSQELTYVDIDTFLESF